MVSNRRRSHIHFIHQFRSDTEEYTGTRIVIFDKKTAQKDIYDIGNFIIHQYKNPKLKKYTVSRWSVKSCRMKDIIKKEMINYSEDGLYRMQHVLYESPVRGLEEYLEGVKTIEMDSIHRFQEKDPVERG